MVKQQTVVFNNNNNLFISERYNCAIQWNPLPKNLYFKNLFSLEIETIS